MTQSFNKQLLDILDVIDSARRYYEIWIALRFGIPPLHEDRVPLEMKQFLSSARFTHYKCMIIDLYMLLDTNSKAVSLRSLFTQAEELGIIDAKARSMGEQRAAAIEPTWKKIRELRHRLFAHTERDVLYDQLMNDLELMASDFEEIIKGALDALDVVWSKHLSKGPVTYSFPPNYYLEQTTKFLDSMLAPYRESD